MQRYSRFLRCAGCILNFLSLGKFWINKMSLCAGIRNLSPQILREALTWQNEIRQTVPHLLEARISFYPYLYPHRHRFGVCTKPPLCVLTGQEPCENQIFPCEYLKSLQNCPCTPSYLNLQSTAVHL